MYGDRVNQSVVKQLPAGLHSFEIPLNAVWGFGCPLVVLQPMVTGANWDQLSGVRLLALPGWSNERVKPVPDGLSCPSANGVMMPTASKRQALVDDPYWRS
jgi:hypothetical protein